jgi:hypothetical protein
MKSFIIFIGVIVLLMTAPKFIIWLIAAFAYIAFGISPKVKNDLNK